MAQGLDTVLALPPSSSESPASREPSIGAWQSRSWRRDPAGFREDPWPDEEVPAEDVELPRLEREPAVAFKHSPGGSCHAVEQFDADLAAVYQGARVEQCDEGDPAVFI